MGISSFKFLVKQLLCVVLIYITGFAPAFQALAQSRHGAGDPERDKPVSSTEAIQDAVNDPAHTEAQREILKEIADADTPEDLIDLPIRDNFELRPQQLHRIYQMQKQPSGEWEPVLVSTYDLSQINPDNPPVGVANFDLQISVVYDDNARELRFQMKKTHRLSGKEYVAHEHVFTEVEIETDGAETKPTLKTANFVFIPQANGTKIVVKDMMASLIFASSIPRMEMLPAVSRLKAEARLKSLQVFSPLMQPRDLQTLDGAELPQFGKVGKDLVAEIEHPDGSVESVYISYDDLVLFKTSQWLKILFEQVRVVNPDLYNADILAEVERAEYEALEQATESEQSLGGLVNEQDGADLGLAALQSFAHQYGSTQMAGQVGRDANGQSRFGRARTAPSHRMDLGDGWRKDFEFIQRVHGLQREAGGSLTPWEQVVAARDAQGFDEQTVVEHFLSKIKTESEVKRGLWDKTWGVVKPYLTSKLYMGTFAVALAFEGFKSVTRNGDTFAPFVRTLLSLWSHSVPTLTEVSTMISSWGDFLGDGFLATPYIALALVPAAIMWVAYRPMTKMGFKLWARVRYGENWSGTKATMVIGMQLLSRFSRAFVIVDGPLRARWGLGQENLYPAHDHGIDWVRNHTVVNWGGRKLRVPWPNEAVWNMPGFLRAPLRAALAPLRRTNPETGQVTGPLAATQAEMIAQNRARLGEMAAEQQLRKRRAMLIAATIVSERAELDGNPIDPATLIQEAQLQERLNHIEDNTEFLTEALRRPSSDEDWSVISVKTLVALQAMADGGVGDIDEESIAEYYQVFKEISGKYNRYHDGRASGASASVNQVANKLVHRWTMFKSWANQWGLPFILGKTWYDRSNQIRNLELTEELIERAESRAEGYRQSTLIFAVFAPKEFVSTLPIPGLFQLKAFVRLLADLTEQVLIYATEVPYDVTRTAAQSGDLANERPPLPEEHYARAKPSEDGGTGRTRGFGDSLRGLAADFADPNSSNTLSRTQKGRMIAGLETLVSRTTAGFIFRAVAMTTIVALGISAFDNVDAAQTVLQGLELGAHLDPSAIDPSLLQLEQVQELTGHLSGLASEIQALEAGGDVIRGADASRISSELRLVGDAILEGRPALEQLLASGKISEESFNEAIAAGENLIEASENLSAQRNVAVSALHSVVGFVETVPRQLYVNLNKMSVGPSTTFPGFYVGYALANTLTVFGINVDGDRRKKNLSRLRLIDHLIDEGVRLRIKAQLTEGVRLIQETFRESGRSLPQHFRRSAEDFSEEEARELHAHSIENPPVATILNPAYNSALNWTAHITSTVLFVYTLRPIIYNTEANPWFLMLYAGLGYVGTYMAVSYLTEPLARKSFGVVRALGSLVGIRRSSPDRMPTPGESSDQFGMSLDAAEDPASRADPNSSGQWSDGSVPERRNIVSRLGRGAAKTCLAALKKLGMGRDSKK